MPASTMYDLELAAQEEELQARRAALAQRVAQSARDAGIYARPGTIDTGGFTSAVTGAPIIGAQHKTPLLSQLSPLIATEADALERRSLARDTSTYRQREQADAQRLIGEMPRQTPTTYGAGDEGPTMTPGTEPTLRDQLEWAMRARANPSLRPTADALVADRIVKEPERAEARAERKATREATLTEAQRRQQEELTYRRERDQQAEQLRRDLAAQSNDLRATIAAAARGTGGDKASDYAIVQGDNGEVFRVGKKPGAPVERVEGAGGKTSTTSQKDALDTRGQIERSTQAINEAPRAKELLGQGSSSGLRADIRRAGSYVAPSVFGGRAQQADEALKPVADLYLKSVPRFEGPQSDADTRSYKEAAAQLANTNLPPAARAAALDEVVRLHAIAIEQARKRTPLASTFSGDRDVRQGKAPTSAPPPSAPPARSVDDLLNKYGG